MALSKISGLVKKASLVAGTQLLHVAWNARSPQQAADVTAFCGFPRKVVQSVRWAAVIAREEREGDFPKGTFWGHLGPPTQSDTIEMPERKNACFSMQVYCTANTRWEALNARERGIAMERIRNALSPLGIRVKDLVPKKDNEPDQHVRFSNEENDK